jgi:signal transduction histidine kinase
MHVTQLTIAPTNAGLSCSTSEQVPHAPWLAARRSYLKTLERLSRPTALSLLTRASGFCNRVFNCSVSPEHCIRGGVDLFQVVINVAADLVLTTAPKNFSLNICRESNVLVLANADDVYWILFILMRNAVKIANRKSRAISILALHISNGNSMVILRLADDGPGLPAAVRAVFGALWRPSTSPRHGYGLAVARELAERNGGSLTLARTDKGTAFALTLPVSTLDAKGCYHVY